MNKREINQKLIVNYKNHLIDEEKSLATITKYIRDIEKFYQYADKKEVTKELVKLYKEELMKSYKPTSINSMLAALNQFFEYNGWLECKIKELKIQKRVFLEESKELSKDEYKRLVNAARKQKNERLYVLLQAICSTGIRVSEHRYITVQALKDGYAQIYNKGKGNEYKALKGIDFQVQDGELVAVIGKSGAGKSTLLHVLAGIDSFESGSYHVGNQDVGQMSEKQLAEFRNKSIGMVMQDFALIEEYTVQENLLVPLIFGKVKKREQSKKIMDVLEKVNIAELKDKRVNQLSGGQKQRVAIARALINSPEYILADEPTGALDSNTSDDIMDVFEELNKNGHTVIIVTHDNGVAARCQRVIEIKDGEVLSE